MAQRSCLISTDTATICIFDLTAIQHRKDDVGDWWSIPRDREVEIVNRSALFLDVGEDGNYQVEIEQNPPERPLGFCLSRLLDEYLSAQERRCLALALSPRGNGAASLFPLMGLFSG